MKKLTREQAETIFSSAIVLNSHVERDESDLNIFVNLSDKSCVLVRYNTLNHEKSYFIKPPSSESLENQ
jgi:hypothetical protein